MKPFRVSVTLLLFASSAMADVTFHLAHRDDRPGTSALVFPNDRRVFHVEAAPYLERGHIISAKVVPTDYGYAVEVGLSAEGEMRFNKLARENGRAYDERGVSALVSLGAIDAGIPLTLIVGPTEALPGRALWWHMDPSLPTDQARTQAEKYVRSLLGPGTNSN